MSIYQAHKLFFYGDKSTIHNKEKLVNKSVKNGYSSNSHKNHSSANICKNSQAQSQGRGRYGRRGSRSGYWKDKTFSVILVSEVNNTNNPNLGD